MAFQAKSYDDVETDASFSIPDEGRYSVTITGIETDRSRKGDPMMVITSTIDHGEEAGYSFKEYIVFSDSNDIGWARLKAICEAADFKWKEKNSLDAFAMQFPLNKLRYSVQLEHSYSVKGWTDTDNRYNWSQLAEQETPETPHQQWVNVQPSRYEDWDGEKNKRAQVMDGLMFSEIYGVPEHERTMQFSEDHMGDGAAQEVVPAGAESEETFEPDDELPF